MENDNSNEKASLKPIKGFITPSERKVISEVLQDENIKDFIFDLRFLFLKYQAAMQEAETKIKILNDDFKLRYKHSPIESIETRIKSIESLTKKMIRNQVAFTIEDVQKKVFDIAGVRIICSFISDIYHIKEMLEQNEEITVLKIKDYVENPKTSGYRSLHMIISLPVYLTTGKEDVCVEIQIRTMAMHYWASLEHKIQYKCDGEIPDDIRDSLLSCSKSIAETDRKMMELNDFMCQFNADIEIPDEIN